MSSYLMKVFMWLSHQLYAVSRQLLSLLTVQVTGPMTLKGQSVCVAWHQKESTCQPWDKSWEFGSSLHRVPRLLMSPKDFMSGSASMALISWQSEKLCEYLLLSLCSHIFRNTTSFILWHLYIFPADCVLSMIINARVLMHVWTNQEVYCTRGF